MTETTTAAEAPAPVLPDLDDFGRMAVDRLIAQVNDLNAAVAGYKAVAGDKFALLEQYREAAEQNENKDVRALAKQISDLLSQVNDLEEKRDAILNEQIDARLADAGDADALKEKVDTLNKAVKAGVSYLTGIYGEDVKGYLPEVARVSGRAGGGNAGKGGRRLRGFAKVTVDGVVATAPDANGVQRSSFSAAAKALKLDSVKPLQEAYTNEFGTDNEKWPAVGTFTFDGHTIEATRDA